MKNVNTIVLYGSDRSIMASSESQEKPLRGYQFKGKINGKRLYEKVLGDPRCITDQKIQEKIAQEKQEQEKQEQNKDKGEKQRGEKNKPQLVERQKTQEEREREFAEKYPEVYKKTEHLTLPERTPRPHIQYFTCPHQYDFKFLKTTIVLQNGYVEDLVAVHKWIGKVHCCMTFGLPDFLKYSMGEYSQIVINRYFNEAKFHLKNNTSDCPDYIIRDILRKEDVI